MTPRTEADARCSPKGRAPLPCYLLLPCTLVLVLGGAIYALGRGIGIELVLGGGTVATVIIVAVAERVWPFERSWNRDHDDTRTDALHLIVSNMVLPELYKRAFVLLLVPVSALIAARFGFGLWPTSWPLIAQLVLSAVIAELFQYWAHRWAHERDALWRVHAVHHSPKRLYWMNAGRDHPLGVLLLYGSETIPLVVLGIGAMPLALQALLTVILGLFQHCNADVRIGPLSWIFSLGELHRWHHSNTAREANHNYGSNLAIWDLVFGSWFLPSARMPAELGIDGMPNFPQRYLGQLAVPFRRRLLRPRAEPVHDIATHR